MIQTDLRASVVQRAWQFALFVRELKIIAGQLVTAIDAGPVQAEYLMDKQNSLSQVKTNITSWPFSLTNAIARAEIARQFPETYADAAAVQAEITTMNGLFTQLMNALDAVLVVARGRGQIVDTDSATGLKTYQMMSQSDTSALRTQAVAVRDAIAG